MKLKIFLPGIILIAFIGIVYGYESFVQLDITGMNHACCGTDIAQIGGSNLYASVCNNSACNVGCQGSIYQGAAIGFQSYISERVELQTGQKYYFCMRLNARPCTPVVQGIAYYIAAHYFDLGTCGRYLPNPTILNPYGFQIVGCPYESDAGIFCWTGGGVPLGISVPLTFSFPFIA